MFCLTATITVLSDAKEMFYFKVHVNYNFNYSITQSKSFTKIREEINGEINIYLKSFIELIGLLKNIMLVTFLFVFIK